MLFRSNGRDLAPNTGLQPMVTVIRTATPVTSALRLQPAIFLNFFPRDFVIGMSSESCENDLCSLTRKIGRNRLKKNWGAKRALVLRFLRTLFYIQGSEEKRWQVIVRQRDSAGSNVTEATANV